nr:alpha/beta hydrolase [Enterovibrio baiacu]
MLGAFWLLGSKLSSPANQTVHLPADAPTAENVTIETISAWYFPVEARKACVLLLHGNRGSKRDMVERAKAVKHLNAPVLFIQGDKDKRTFLYEALMLFDNAPEPKYLNVMEGAAHVDLHSFNTDQYETTVLSFLAEHLDPPPQKRSSL